MNTCLKCDKKLELTFPYCPRHLKELCNLEVKKSNIKGAELGLFYVGSEPLKPNQIITYYSAETVDSSFDENDMIYVLQISKTKYLDAKPIMNWPGRYINGAYGDRKSINVKFSATYVPKFHTDSNRFRISIKTNKVIHSNTELIVDYDHTK